MQPWRLLGQGEIGDASNAAFLTSLAWGGLEAGTLFGEPSPLFPRAEKDAVQRMVQLEEENTKSVIEAAGGRLAGGGGDSEPSAPLAANTESHAGVKALAATTELKKMETKAMEDTKTTTAETTPVAQSESGANPVTAAAQEAAQALPAAPVAAETTPAGEQHNAPTLVPAEPPAASAQITIDDFAKVELRVAQILVAERVPKADKLLRLEVDLGYEKRQILAGIAQYYEPEKLIGRKIVIVANLAPRKMRGLESNGMLLAASLEGGAPVLTGFLEEVPLGARLK